MITSIFQIFNNNTILEFFCFKLYMDLLFYFIFVLFIMDNKIKNIITKFIFLEESTFYGNFRSFIKVLIFYLFLIPYFLKLSIKNNDDMYKTPFLVLALFVFFFIDTKYGYFFFFLVFSTSIFSLIILFNWGFWILKEDQDTIHLINYFYGNPEYFNKILLEFIGTLIIICYFLYLEQTWFLDVVEKATNAEYLKQLELTDKVSYNEIYSKNYEVLKHNKYSAQLCYSFIRLIEFTVNSINLTFVFMGLLILLILMWVKRK